MTATKICEYCGMMTIPVYSSHVCKGMIDKPGGMPEPIGYSQWIAYGKKYGYHDYWKDMTRIAIMENIIDIIKIKFNGFGGTLGFTETELLELIVKIK